MWRDTTTDSADSAEDSVIQRSRVDYVVYVQRTLNGIQVVNNRLAFIYENDGKLRSINGKWHQINYADSHLDTQKKTDEIADMASDAVAKMDIDVNAITRIETNVIYLVIKNEYSENIIDLKLMVTAYTKDIENDGAALTVELDL